MVFLLLIWSVVGEVEESVGDDELGGGGGMMS